MRRTFETAILICPGKLNTESFIADPAAQPVPQNYWSRPSIALRVDRHCCPPQKLPIVVGQFF